VHDVVRYAAATALALSLAVPARARAQDQGQVNDLAQLLSLEDRRDFDLAALRRDAQHPDPLIRAQAAVAIGRIGDRAGTPLLVTLLNDPDTTVRAQAAFSLGMLRDTAAADELARRMDAFPDTVSAPDQLELVTALAKIGGLAAARAFDALLQRHPSGGGTGDQATAVALLEAWRLGRRAPAERLVEYVRSGSGTWRRNATFSAGRLRLAGAAAAFLDAATDADPVTRAYATRGLTEAVADAARIPPDAFMGRLRALAGDSDAQVRISALRSLASYGDSTLVGLVQARLVDPDPNVVVQAITTLGYLGGSRAVQSLKDRFVQGPSFAARRAALLALAQAAPGEVLETAQGWRADPDWRLRSTYAEALAYVRTDSSRATLTAMVADSDPRVAESALASLGAVAPDTDAAVRALAMRSLAHPDWMVRATAIALLDRLKDPSLIPALVAAYRAATRDVQDDACLAAVAALADLTDVDAARVEREFLAAVPRSRDFLVRRLVAERFGAEIEAQYWGGVYPVDTGHGMEDYRDLARTLLLPALQGAPAPRVTIETDRGSLVLTLDAADAPLTVQSFLQLVDRRYFDNGRWHRVVPGFVIQDGDPRGDGNGGPGWAIRDEINRQRYDRGAVGMALSGPDTGGSQFFVTDSPQPHLDGVYTVFGHVLQGYDVVDQIVQGDRIRRIIR
jgi:cyclophilin family peptidyl-prolyl cis-trans isomerase/HEAT repeat protein